MKKWFRAGLALGLGLLLEAAGLPAEAAEQESVAAAPVPVGEMAQMDYAPLFPVYVWREVEGAVRYELQVLREDPEEEEPEPWHTCYVEGNVLYDEAPLNCGGVYLWQVRGLDESGEPVSEWSAPERLQVSSPAYLAALGDSITHGGAGVQPACLMSVCWESYAGLRIKNLGHSGDTTADMLARFERDVLPFEPRILVIMGGVNDYRLGISAAESIAHLEAIRDKCRERGIVPVFVTPTPVNPVQLVRYAEIEPLAPDWKENQLALNRWVMSQFYAVDVTPLVTAEDGTLKKELSADGLHPQAEGKRMMGEAIGNYLRSRKLIGPR